MIEARLSVLESSFESASLTSVVGCLLKLLDVPTVDVESVIEEDLSVLSPPDWRYFLLSSWQTFESQ